MICIEIESYLIAAIDTVLQMFDAAYVTVVGKEYGAVCVGDAQGEQDVEEDAEKDFERPEEGTESGDEDKASEELAAGIQQISEMGEEEGQETNNEFSEDEEDEEVRHPSVYTHGGSKVKLSYNLPPTFSLTL